jgi:hypothetical protein
LFLLNNRLIVAEHDILDGVFYRLSHIALCLILEEFKLVFGQLNSVSAVNGPDRFHAGRNAAVECREFAEEGSRVSVVVISIVEVHVGINGRVASGSAPVVVLDGDGLVIARRLNAEVALQPKRDGLIQAEGALGEGG